MTFGFLIEKFSLFLWTDLKAAGTVKLSSLAVSNFLGVIVVGMGALLGLLSLIRYLHVEREIENNMFRPSIILDSLCGLIFFVLSLVLFYYIINWHSIIVLS
jgi:putative membrane protein